MMRFSRTNSDLRTVHSTTLVGLPLYAPLAGSTVVVRSSSWITRWEISWGYWVIMTAWLPASLPYRIMSMTLVCT